MRIFVFAACWAGVLMQQIDIHIDGKAVSRIVGVDRPGDIAGLFAGEREVFLVYDRNVAWVADAVEAAVSAPVLCGRMALTATEEGKDMAAVLDICRWLLESGASRNALLLAIGGGITTDMAGFAASIYKRGIRYANIPTTLLAQVDAGIGGKTGVNYLEYKNMLGVIVQPVFTVLCADVLRTLPPRDFHSGVAELLKTFLIEDRDGGYERAVRLLSFRKWAEYGNETRERGVSSQNKGPNGNEWLAELQALVFAAAAVKAGVVSRDPFERGERRKLNLGHTFAHAIEHVARVKGDDITHGEAVAMGMVLAAQLADRLYGRPADYADADNRHQSRPAEKAAAGQDGGADWCDGCAERATCPGMVAWPGMEARLRADFTAAGLPVACPYPLAELAGAMDKDKKAAGGRVRFQLPVAVGRVEEVELTPREAIRLLAEA